MTKSGAVPDRELGGDSPIMTCVPKVCPKCGADVLPDAPEGLCTACLFETGLDLLTNESVAAGDGGCSENIKVSDSIVARLGKKESERPNTFADFGDYELLEVIGR